MPFGARPVIFDAVSDQLLTVLKLCLLALLYLFFFRVVRAVWAEISTTAPAPGPVPAPVPAGAPKAAPAGAPAPAAQAPRPTRLVIIEPAELRGKAHALEGDVTIGRAASCSVTLDDTFASQQHARVSAHSGQYVVEDLGSTNGTYLNRQRVAGPAAVNPGDRIQIGNTVLELV